MGWYWPTLRRVPRQWGGGETHLDLALGAASSIICSPQKATDRYFANDTCNAYRVMTTFEMSEKHWCLVAT